MFNEEDNIITQLVKNNIVFKTVLAILGLLCVYQQDIVSLAQPKAKPCYHLTHREGKTKPRNSSTQPEPASMSEGRGQGR